MKFRLLISLSALSGALFAHDEENFHLRLEPVWSRVADVLGERGSVESVEFSRDGRKLVSGTKYDNAVIMWRASDGAELWRQYAEEEVERVGWSADDQYVAAASEDFLVTVYDAKTGDVVKELPHDRGVDGLIWSNKGRLLASGEERIENADGSIEGYLKVYDFDKGEWVAKLNFGDTVNELFFTQDDQYLLAVGHGAVKVYEVEGWRLVQSLEPEFKTVFTSGTFSPDGEKVVAVGQGGNARGTAYMWEWRSGKLLRSFNHTGKKIESIAWHPNGEYVAHAGHDPYIYVYRVRDIIRYKNDNIPIAHKVWAGDHAEYVDFNDDGSFFASAHQNGLIKLWVWMGEDPDLNSRLHEGVKATQSDKNL